MYAGGLCAFVIGFKECVFAALPVAGPQNSELLAGRLDLVPVDFSLPFADVDSVDHCSSSSLAIAVLMSVVSSTRV